METGNDLDIVLEQPTTTENGQIVTDEELINECIQYIKDENLYDKTLRVAEWRPATPIRPILEYEQHIVDEAFVRLNKWLCEVWAPINGNHKPTLKEGWDRKMSKWERELSHIANDREKWLRMKREEGRRRLARKKAAKQKQIDDNYQALIDMGVIEP